MSLHYLVDSLLRINVRILLDIIELRLMDGHFQHEKHTKIRLSLIDIQSTNNAFDYVNI